MRTEIQNVVYGCCKELYEKRLKEHRNDVRAQQKEARDRERSEKADSMTLKDAVLEVLPEALNKVSGEGTLPFSNRQFLYVVRDFIQQYDTRKELKDGRFTGIIKEYQEEYGKIEGLYKEPRGDFYEPHTGVKIPFIRVRLSIF